MTKAPVKEVDFVIGYELWKRELFGVTLLKLELERRGYTVELVNRCVDVMSDHRRDVLAPRVVVYPWVYTDTDVERARAFQGNVRNIVNLQSEQFFSDYILQRFSKFAEGQAAKAYHVCWGALTKERFLAAGVDEDHVRVCGNLHLDVDNEKFGSLFRNRAQIAETYGLDETKTWVMFLSNFKQGTLYPDPREKTTTKKERAVAAMQIKAKAFILKTIASYLETRDDCVFIYRPHPDEGQMDNSDVAALEAQYPNFRAIADGSLQEWVRVCDLFLDYISTGVTDAYYLRKSAALMRDEPVPKQVDNDLFTHGARCIQNETDLAAFIDDARAFPIAPHEVWKNLIDNIDASYLAYERLADYLEEIYQKEETSFDAQTERAKPRLRHRIRRDLFFMRGGKSFEVVQRRILKPLYQKAETKDMTRWNGVARFFRVRTFTDQRETIRREEEFERTLRPFVTGKAQGA